MNLIEIMLRLLSVGSLLIIVVVYPIIIMYRRFKR